MSSDLAATCGRGASGCRFGLVLARESEAKISCACGAGGNEQQGRRDQFQLVCEHGSKHLPGQGRRHGRSGLSGREADGGSRRAVAEGGGDEGRGGSISQPDSQDRAGRDQAATGDAAAELFPRSSQAAVKCSSRQFEPVRGFGQRQSLEVTEDNRQTKRPWQSGNFVVKDLGLLASDRRYVSRRHHRLDHRVRTRTAHGVAPLVLALAAQPRVCLLGRAQRHPIEPCSQQVGVSDRSSPAGQDEEDSLKGILGMVVIAQDLAADAQHHRPVSRDQMR